MASKKKGKAKGKKKAKGRSGSPSRSKKGGGKKMEAGQASAVLTFIMVESRKQSVLLYRTQFMELKAELKALRDKLRRVQQERYGHLRNVLDTTDAMAGKLESMQQSPGLGLVMDMASDQKLVYQQQTIEALHDILHTTTQILSGLTGTHATLLSSSAMASLAETLSALQTAQVEQRARHEAEVTLLRRRHQAAIDGSVKRGEKIVMGVEGGASQHELDTMPWDSVATLQRNARLKARTKVAAVEVQRLKTLICELEELNLAKVCQDGGEVAWDLGLGLASGLEEEENEEPGATGRGSRNSDTAQSEEEGKETWAAYRLKLPILPIARQTALSLDPDKILYMERARRDRQIAESKLALLGKRLELRKVDLHNGGGLLYSRLAAPSAGCVSSGS
ncbi:hypothetical protein HDU87_000710 [Geranomyces variabilis]|uniref:Uncharacterized protein n=1 Tax=Geranomyces variabilis TaxID=109894 RepID=A0AAD5TN72_9FUNG|nr:hypothetical protein HDU87_000710 [Geranomyces variabilis]